MPKDRPIVAMTLEQCWHEVPGGTAVAALGMARALAERSDVVVKGVSAKHSSPPPEPWVPPVPVDGLPLPRVALYESWHRLRTPSVERATGPVDVIHATTIAIPPKSAPLIVTIHDLLFLRYPEHFTKHGLNFFQRGLKLARKDADIVMCPSEATMRACLDEGFDASKLRVIPLGVDARRADTDDVARVRKHYEIEAPYVMWTGTIEPRKNLRGLLEAWKDLGDEVDLVLVGPRGWNEDLDALIGDTGNRVHVLGFVPADDLDALLAGADVFCFPSLGEGFGFPILEAMQQGTPVVTSAGTSTEEVAGEAGLIVDPNDSGAIRSALADILGDESLAQKLSNAGLERATEFTWARTAEGLMDAYREIAA